MNKYIKMQAVALLVCGSVSYASFADNMANEATQVTTTTQQDPSAVSNAVKTTLGEYAGKVDVTVKDGVVYLAGALPSDTDYERVITLAESTKGVEDVDAEKLTVKDSKHPLKDTYITAKIKGSLIQSEIMGKEVPAWSVGVETKDGQVFLSGNVNTQEEKDNLVKVVKAVKGVTKVNDQITVGKNDQSHSNDEAVKGNAPTSTETN
jgi:hyperosmotically inducible protein